jgi:hypothetical protein
VHKDERHNQTASTGDAAQATFSISGIEFSVARLVLPGTDTEATTVVGEMPIAADSPGRPARKITVVGTAVTRIGEEPAARAEIVVRVVPDVAPEAADSRRAKPRRGRQRRRHAGGR